MRQPQQGLKKGKFKRGRPEPEKKVCKGGNARGEKSQLAPTG